MQLEFERLRLDTVHLVKALCVYYRSPWCYLVRRGRRGDNSPVVGSLSFSRRMVLDKEESEYGDIPFSVATLLGTPVQSNLITFTHSFC